MKFAGRRSGIPSSGTSLISGAGSPYTAKVPPLKRERAHESSGKCGGASLSFATRRRGREGRVSEDESCLSSGEKLATRRKRSESAIRRPG